MPRLALTGARHEVEINDVICCTIDRGIAAGLLHQGLVPTLSQAAGILMRLYLDQLQLPLVKVRHEFPQMLPP
jgi:hypothetical protein